MSKYCRPKVRTMFRKSHRIQGNRVRSINYPDPVTIWKLMRNMKKAVTQANNNAVLKEKE
jgi:hypothetical protein